MKAFQKIPQSAEWNRREDFSCMDGVYRKKNRTSRNRPGKTQRGLSEHAGGDIHEIHHTSRYAKATAAMAMAIGSTAGSV
jgi:hypothetical protein